MNNKPSIDLRYSQRRGINSIPTDTDSTNSAPIPLPRSHLHRTRSEVALEAANELADWRENRMYHRLLTGMIRRSQEKGLDQNPKIIRSLENLIQIQASPISSLDTSSKQNEEWGIISCSPDDENQEARNSQEPYISSTMKSSSASSWSSAMSGGMSSPSLSRRPSRIRLSLTPLRESFKDEGIFDLEL
mmetsp:Transcript_16150/g.26511  ORF Transcript_16150/g.26511 Transcript_16150/m.26511 type:complete len:189 (+) Transcript_16150:343-909(+)|eukprot:scaffold4932_cov123-Skeletonema_menzelii.AAC.1